MVGGNLFGIEGGILFEAGGGKVLEIFRIRRGKRKLWACGSAKMRERSSGRVL
jgi:hypothetical protein